MAKGNHPLDRFVSDIPPGTVNWIGLRPIRREPLQSVESTRAVAGYGLEGDHRMKKKPDSSRQVTLISREFIDQIEHFTGHKNIEPGTLRRNILVSDINLNALQRQRFRVGDALLEATELCDPCARMDEALGEGTVAAMIGHGGLCAKIIESGDIAVGDKVQIVPAT